MITYISLLCRTQKPQKGNPLLLTLSVLHVGNCLKFEISCELHGSVYENNGENERCEIWFITCVNSISGSSCLVLRAATYVNMVNIAYTVHFEGLSCQVFL